MNLGFWWSFWLAVPLTFAATWSATIFLRSIGVKID
jgi:hypothetical protein